MRIQLAVPANTPIGTPFVLTVPYVQSSVITHEEIKVPDGHAYLTGLQIRAWRSHGTIIPETGSNTEWLVDNGRIIIRNTRVLLDPPQYSIEFRAYNLDNVYTHVYTHTFYIDLE